MEFEPSKRKDREDEKMKVTLIIQNRNYAHFLERSIKSALEIDFPKDQYEIIGMDADSTDNSVDIYKKYPQVKLLEVGLVSQATALNKALKIAKGEYISFINSDDQYKPNFIKQHIVGFEMNDNNHVLAYSRSEEIVEATGEKIPCYTKFHPKEELANSNFIFQPSTMIKREALDQVGGFDEKIKYAFDYKLWCDLAFIGDFIYVDEETTIYSVRSESWGNKVKADETMEANMIRENFAERLKNAVKQNKS